MSFAPAAWPDLPGRGAFPRVMGILNATPDSFAGDGLGQDVEGLVARARAQIADGAALLDVGGESTRPDSVPISASEECDRVLPVIRRLIAEGLGPISIDTTKAIVADAALTAGATVVNDVSGLRDIELAGVAARNNTWLIVMHNGWTMPKIAEDVDIVDRVVRGIECLVHRATDAGVKAERIIVDPGIGFGKNPLENLELLQRTAEICERLSPFPLLVGPSRKRFIGNVLGVPVDNRLEGTLACVAIAVFGGAAFVRVHDVGPAVHVARMARAIRNGRHAGRHHRLQQSDRRSRRH